MAERTGRQGYVLPLSRAKSRSDVAERRFIEDLKGLSSAVGIPKKRLTLHRFRHFFVSECADPGVPMATVMNWVGHDEMKMVMHYYSLRDDTAREAMRRLTSGTAASMATTTTVKDQAVGSVGDVPPTPKPQAESREKPRGNGQNGRSGKGGARPAAQDRTSWHDLDYLWIN